MDNLGRYLKLSEGYSVRFFDLASDAVPSTMFRASSELVEGMT
jgi:hypothetical protein